MRKQLYFEDVEAGYKLKPLDKHPTTQQLVRYAGASGDYYQIHYDKDFALANKLPGVILHGALKNAFLAQLMTNFAGDEGWLRNLSVQYRGMDIPDRMLRCNGEVTSKRVQGSDHIVECEIWLENDNGERTTRGTAVVILPSRAPK
jgi:acyl dehydratase